MRLFYCDKFVLPLPKGHRFPMEKYAMLRRSLEISLPEAFFQVPEPVTEGQLALAHCPHYIRAVLDGHLSEAQQKSIGFPWSPAMVERSLRSVGATVEAAFCAMREGASVNLAGGTHHAKQNSGSGFCVFNDQIVAARALQASEMAQGRSEPQILIVDLDVHQGDGSAQIAQTDPSIFTFSMHGERNYPFTKERSDLDIGLPAGTGDKEYLAQLQLALAEIESRFTPNLLFYVAGHDVHQADRLGRLSITDEGISQRNKMVFDFAKRLQCPLVMSMAGGYFPDLNHLVALQTRSICQLAEWSSEWVVPPTQRMTYTT